MTPEAARELSHNFLAAHKVRVNSSLPTIEPSTELSPRSAIEVSRRAVVLGYVVVLGLGHPGPKLLQSLEKFGLTSSVSEKELQMFKAPELSKEKRAAAVWEVESIQALAWCLELTELDPFSSCDDTLASLFPLANSDPSDFVANASLRAYDELYQMADLHYRLHWAARDARLTGASSALDENIIEGRRRALDWVVGVEPNWDQVPLDT